MREIDFTRCPRVPGLAYNGANGKKLAVSFEGAVWLLKFPPSAKDRPNDLSYSNSCISEHLGCLVFRHLGIPVQETRLGVYVNGRRRVVCACRDFTVPGKRLLDFCSIKNTVVDSETGGRGTELADVLDTIDRQQFVDPVVVRRRFWEMFVVDALIGNFDRHNGNWGFLVDERTGRAELAPVFDCGSALLPQADESVMRAVLSNSAEMEARIYTFPRSAFKQDGVKINYADFISTSMDDGLGHALDRLLPLIRQLDFRRLVRETPFLSELQASFLSTYLDARREGIFRVRHRGGGRGGLR